MVKKNLNAIKNLERKLLNVDSDNEICNFFGRLKAELEKEGNVLDDADLFIAGCAMKNNYVLVTNNEKHFSRIKGLRIENWTK